MQYPASIAVFYNAGKVIYGIIMLSDWDRERRRCHALCV